MPNLFLGNDHTLTLVGLRDSQTLAFVEGATVTCTLEHDEIGGTEVAGQTWPLTMTNTSQTGSVGGDATTPTTVESVAGWDVTVTVGATEALSLTAGDIIEVLHDEENKWRVARDASGAADATGVVIHVEPYVYPDDAPTKFTATTGEVLLLSAGTYAATLAHDNTVTDGENYYAKIDVVSGSINGQFYLKAKAKYRT